MGGPAFFKLNGKNRQTTVSSGRRESRRRFASKSLAPPLTRNVPHSASLRGERGAEPVPLPVAPLRENQGHETDRFAAAQPRVRPTKGRQSMIPSSLLTKMPQRQTSQENAWQDGKYDTYRLNFEIPAVRVHRYGTPLTGDWYAVDEYNLSVSTYHDRYALLSKYKRPQLEIFLLRPGTTVNVGKARRQGPFLGGGLQFEVLFGSPQPQHLEHVDDPKRIRY